MCECDYCITCLKVGLCAIIDTRDFRIVKLYIIAKYGNTYFDELEEKIKMYIGSIIADKPLDYERMFNEDIRYGCAISAFIRYNIILEPSPAIIFEKHKLAIDTIKHCLKYHLDSIGIKFSNCELFSLCVNNKTMEYFQYFVDGFTSAAGIDNFARLQIDTFYNGIHDSYAKYLLTLDTGNQLDELVYVVLCSLYGKDKVKLDIKNSRNHGAYYKTKLVISNYEKINSILEKVIDDTVDTKPARRIPF